MKVFLTGSTGFVGKEILNELIKNGNQVTCLVRPKTFPYLESITENVEFCPGGAFDFKAIKNGMKNCDAVIHLIGIIREFYWKGITFKKHHLEATKNIVNAAVQNGIKRFILMSALGVEKDLNTKYMNTKREMENIVKDNGFNYTIFRPSVIFGKEDKFINMFYDLIKNPFIPFVPVVGKGDYLLQPISVKNVAQMFVQSLKQKETVGKTYKLAGKDQITMNQLLDIIGQSAGKEKITKLHLPVWFMKMLAFLFNQIPQFPISNEQIKMLFVGNTSAQWEIAFKEFQLEPDSIYDYLVKV